MIRRSVLMVEPVGSGGFADYTALLADALAARGRDVAVATASDHRYGFPARFRVIGIVRWFRASTAWRRSARRLGLGPPINAVGFLLVLPGLAALARRAGLVHIQGHYHPPLLAALVLVLRAVGVPVVHTPHDTFDRGHAHRWARTVTARLAAATVVHVHADLERLPARTGSRAEVIPHGEYGGLARSGGAADRGAARRDLGLGDEPLVLLFGQLRRDKGIRDVLEAAIEVPGVRVLIAGEEIGGLAAAGDVLEAPALRGRVFVREGFHDMPAVAAFFAAADAVVLPYRQVSQSGVQLLAYGFERPVVVYPVAGLVEGVIEGETGWIAKRSDPPALAQALAALVAAGSSECLRRGRAAGRLAEERYSWAAIAERTEGVYERALAS